MTNTEFADYWMPARNVYHSFIGHKGNLMRPVSVKLADLLGTDEHEKYSVASIPAIEPPMDENLKQVLIAIAGPHGHTVLKMLTIRKEANEQQRVG